MDYRTLTIGDCMRKLEQEGMAAVIEDGAVAGFVEEKSLNSTADTVKAGNPTK